MENQELPNKHDEIGHVALPFNEDQFKDFIVSLLGKPQTINKYFSGSYEIDKDSLIAIFELLEQRIHQQNEARLIQFRATIYYHDNSVITLNGLEHLLNFNERLPLISTAVHLTWQYLVKFNDKATFEKQEISVSFVRRGSNAELVIDDKFISHHENSIIIRIAHTARTWGADVEALLSKHIKSIIDEKDRLRFFRYGYERLDNFLSVILLGITLVFVIPSTFEAITLSSSVEIINYYGQVIILIVGIFVLKSITYLLLEYSDFYMKPSFILLTQAAETDKQKTIKNYKKSIFKYFFTLLTSIVTGIMANYFYANL